MPIAEDSTLTVEKTPAYFTHPPYEIPHLIKKGVPDAKLILILCDPVKRVLSNFLQEVSITKNDISDLFHCSQRNFCTNFVFLESGINSTF